MRMRRRSRLRFHRRQITIDVVGSETKENNYDDVIFKRDFLLFAETCEAFNARDAIKGKNWRRIIKDFCQER